MRPGRNVRGLVLASGLSERFGPDNKLLQRISGRSVIDRVVSAFVEALGECWVVVQPDAEDVAAALSHLDVHLVPNSGFMDGQSAALRRGLSRLPADTEAVVIGVADQPLLRASTIRAIVHRWRSRGSLTVAPTYARLPGNPVLFARALFHELSSVSGDVGGRAVLSRHSPDRISIPEWWTKLDVDSPEDLVLAERYLTNPPTDPCEGD